MCYVSTRYRWACNMQMHIHKHIHTHIHTCTHMHIHIRPGSEEVGLSFQIQSGHRKQPLVISCVNGNGPKSALIQQHNVHTANKHYPPTLHHHCNLPTHPPSPLYPPPTLHHHCTSTHPPSPLYPLINSNHLLEILGVCLNSDLTPSMHCSNIAAMAFNRSCLLLKCFHSNDVSLLVRLYKVIVRPLLESNTQVWNPWFHNNIQCIERVQRFFTRAILKRAGVPYMDYDDRLANLGLQSLEYRRVFYDLVMCYKIYNNLVDLPFESFFTKPVRSYSIRGHPCILRSKHLPHHAFRAHFFTERVIPIWNHLPMMLSLH